MKKFYISMVCAFLCACSSGEKIVKEDAYIPSFGTTQTQHIPVFGNEDSTYLIGDFSKLYFLEPDLKTVMLTGLSYVDDKPVEDMGNHEIERYSDHEIGPVQFYGNNMYYLVEKETIDGQKSYYFCSLDQKGEARKQLLQLDYVPSGFLIHRAVVAIMEDGEQCKVHLYDQSLKDIKTIPLDDYGLQMFAEEDQLYIPVSERVMVVDLDSYESKIIDSNGFFLMINQGKYATRKLSQKITEVSDPKMIINTCSVYDVNSGEELFSVEDELIGYFDESRIYTTTLKDPVTKYRIYDYDHQLIKEIVPSDDIQSTRNVPILFYEQDCDQIIRVMKGNIISGALVDEKYTYYGCNIESGKCQIIRTE